jgi:hypothetical protein
LVAPSTTIFGCEPAPPFAIPLLLPRQASTI